MENTMRTRTSLSASSSSQISSCHDDATRLVLIDKAIFGKSLDDIILSFLLRFLLLTLGFFTDNLLDVRGGFLR